METFSRPPSRGTSDCADPEASWGHRSGGGPGQDSELFFGYYASAATMTREEHGPPVPELGQASTTTPPDRQATSVPRTARRSAPVRPAPAPRQTSPAGQRAGQRGGDVLAHGAGPAGDQPGPGELR